MDTQTILDTFKEKANPSRQKTYLKAGAPEATWGVPMGIIRDFAKKIKIDHELGLELWQTGLTEARLLAVQIMDPNCLSMDEAVEMIASCSYDQLADELVSRCLVKSSTKEEIMRHLFLNQDDVSLRAYWSFIVDEIAHDKRMNDERRSCLLDRIEMDLIDAEPQTQWMMNRALAEIGFRSSNHTNRALQIGERLGVYKDMVVAPGCTSAYAPAWIQAVLKRKK